MNLSELPIYEIAEPFRESLLQQNKLLISAPTGSGKSTQIPQWLLDRIPDQSRILVLQPRRLAARMLAERVAWERGEKLGETVGFQTRYESACQRNTRILFITEGILARMLVSTPSLPGISAIIFDEFHERSLNIDLALAMSCHSQNTLRADLRLIVMSATMDAAVLQKYLRNCPHLHASGKLYPVSIQYRSRGAARNHYQAAAGALRELLQSSSAGDVLIFMPGGAEIRHCAEAIRQLSSPELLQILPLYGALSPDEQRKVMLPCPRRKIIIATNIAETSLTIPGVRHVIDSGLVRSSRFDAVRQVSILETIPIARDSAEQRAGRAGREAPGSCWRLWSELEQSAKPARSIPEIQRCDLADALLTVTAFGFPNQAEFPWFEVPPEKNFKAGKLLLEQLGILDKQHGGLTTLGATIQRFPVHPRLALLLWHGQNENCPWQAAFAAAVLSERPLITGASSDRATMRQHRQELKNNDKDLPQSDFIAYLNMLEEARKSNFSMTACQSLGLNTGAARDVFRAANDFYDLLAQSTPIAPAQSEVNFLKILLRVFPDRLARRLDKGTLICELQGRRRAELARTSLAREETLFLAGEIREVPAKGVQAVKLELSLASGIREEWLWDIFPDEFRDEEETFWDSVKQQVLRRRRLSCLDLTLEESVRNDANPEQAASILAAQLSSNNMHLQGWDESVEAWIARVRWLAEHFPEKKLPQYTEEDRSRIHLALCQGEYTYKAVRFKACLPFVKGILSPEQSAFVEQMAPTHLPLPKGRRLRIEYIPGQPPRGRARIQELFDFKEKAAVAKGQIPILLDILAPNMRTVQITDDLPRFWEVHYPALRSALARRYPKHEWR
ncbi:MAG: ATP-dependent helicase HrpB [Lentisphaeria bacterium]